MEEETGCNLAQHAKIRPTKKLPLNGSMFSAAYLSLLSLSKYHSLCKTYSHKTRQREYLSLCSSKACITYDILGGSIMGCVKRFERNKMALSEWRYWVNQLFLYCFYAKFDHMQLDIVLQCYFRMLQAIEVCLMVAQGASGNIWSSSLVCVDNKSSI